VRVLSGAGGKSIMEKKLLKTGIFLIIIGKLFGLSFGTFCIMIAVAISISLPSLYDWKESRKDMTQWQGVK